MSNALGLTLSGLGDEAGGELEQQIQAHLELGWKEIELRSAVGQALSDWEPACLKQTIRAIKDAGLQVTVVASRIANWERPITGPFETDMEELRRAAERMQALGARYIRVMSYPNDHLPEQEWKKRVLERFHKLTETAEAEGIVLLHENCAGWAGTKAENALELMEEIDNPHLRVLFDTGNGIAYRYSTYEYLKKVWPYVKHVHIKDGRFLEGKAVYSLPGEGDSEVSDCLIWLLDHGYSGILSIEPHLHLIPHLKQSGDPADLRDSYITYGKHLERMLNDLHNTHGPWYTSSSMQRKEGVTTG